MHTLAPARQRRARLAILASGLALALTVGALPVSAQDSPETPVVGLLDALSEKRFSDLGTYFCPEFAAQAEGLDLTGAMAASLPAGIDIQLLLDSLVFSVEGLDVSVADETDTSALVSVDATLTMSVDSTAAVPLMLSVFEQFGLEPTEEMLATAIAEMEGEMVAEPQVISEDVTVTRGEDGAWLICSAFGEDDPIPDVSEASPVVEESPVAGG